MHVPQQDHTTVAGTVTGTVFTVIANIDLHYYTQTVILAVVGATSSFLVSILLKWIWKILRDPQKPKS